MSFNRFFMMYNDLFMYVEPVEALKQRSKHVAAVVERGDIFAVNMKSGALTVVTKKKLDAAGYNFHPAYGFEPPLDQKEAEFKEPAKIYTYQSYHESGKRQLPLDVEKALVVLKRIYLSNVIADLIKARMLYVFSNQSVTPISFTENDSWNDYERKVRNFYRKH
jgi:hypothetical protein